MTTAQLYENQNKGLPTRFQLVNGKFQLIGGRNKVDDNVAMLMAFIGGFRLYTQDYVIDAYQFFQNTTSYLYQFKNILRLRIMDIGSRYLPFATFRSVDIPVNYENRKETTLYIQFQYNLRNANDYQTLKKVIL